MDKYLKQVKSQEVKDWVNTTLKAYIKKHGENQSEIEHILDFLGSNEAPSRLRKMSYAQAKTGAEKWVKTLNKKAKDIDDTGELEVVTSFSDGFKLARLAGKAAYEREGLLMGHCVAAYFGKDSEIYSLRDDKNKPHCTIEVVRGQGKVNQIKGKGNGSISPKYIQKILKILDYFNLDVNSDDMSNLGYVYLEDYEIKFFEKLNTKVKLFKYKSETYLFKGC